MITACEAVEEMHQRLLPTALLSSVIDDCLDRGVDVTRGGAHYNLSGIQIIQVANVADSLAALKKLVFDEGQDTGPDNFGAAVVDNVDVNGTLVGQGPNDPN